MNKGFKKQILKLREEGKSYSEISLALGCVKSTVSFHCNNRTAIRHRVSISKRNKKLKAVEYKGGKCEKCGYNKCLRALQFHHIDPKTKEFGISYAGGLTKNWKDLKPELDKCMLLCSNCHFEEHERLDNINN